MTFSVARQVTKCTLLKTNPIEPLPHSPHKASCAFTGMPGDIELMRRDAFCSLEDQIRARFYQKYGARKFVNRRTHNNRNAGDL